MECFAESLGVFLYVFCGVGSQLAYIIGGVIGQAGLSSVLQIGFAYAFGILFALGVAAGVSGGHFSPAVTICFVLFKGFPARKAFRYIVAQIFGGYVGSMLVYYQWKPLIQLSVGALVAEGKSELLFTPNGPPGAFGLYLLPGMTLGSVFLNEFVCCVFVGLVIWAAQDPTNAMLPPVMAAPTVALAYAAAIWSFATPGIALNAARDVGGRLWALTIWGLEAGGGRYAAIAALTNIPATIFAVVLYEMFLVDSDKPINPQAMDFVRLAQGNRRHVQETNGSVINEKVADAETGQDSKPSITAYEIAPR